MKRHLLTAIASGLFLLLATVPGYAPPPVPPPGDPCWNVADAFEREPIAFLATMVEGKAPEEGSGVVKMQVLYSWKGDLSGVQEVDWWFGMRYYGGGMNFQIGTTYVVMGGQVQQGKDKRIHSDRFVTKAMPADLVKQYVVTRDGKTEVKKDKLAETVEVDGRKIPRLIVEGYGLEPKKKGDVEQKKETPKKGAGP